MKETSILFDLDGTLLPLDFDEFLKRYFQALSQEFRDLAEPDKLIKILLKASNEMINNKGAKTNKEVFIASFFSYLNVADREQVLKRFDIFYQERFPLLKQGLKINTAAAGLVDYLKRKGYQLVLATNPVFPLEAIEERASWAGLNLKDFSLVTHYANMHYCKPNPEYYREILDKIGKEAAACIMVGNDVNDDLVAQDLGIKTFLVEDFLIPGKGKHQHPYWRGSLAALEEYFRQHL